jgi:hypothetical protein
MFSSPAPMPYSRLTRPSMKCEGQSVQGQAFLRTLTLTLLLGVLVAVLVGPRAVAVTRRDAIGDAGTDVLRSRRWREFDEGVSMVRLGVTAILSDDWSVVVFLDTRGGPKEDFRLRNFEAFGMGRCLIWRLPDGAGRHVPCGRTFTDDPSVPERLWWAVRKSELAPDRAIRWRIRTRDLAFQGPNDRAPDRGWYP